MGEPVKIADLARDLITLAGYEPDKDIQIKYTGIRPGEKLYEELFTDREGMQATKHERIFISQKKLDEKYEGILNTVTMLHHKHITNHKELIKLIATLVPEFRRPAAEIDDETMNEEIAITEENGQAQTL